MSIIKALKKIEDEKLTSFHVPGHKNGRYLQRLPYGESIGGYDTTEIPGSDNLHAAETCILKVEKEISSFYGSLASYLLVNGTTAGIISMIYASFKPGDRVIISRDAHKAIFTGMILAGVEPVYIGPVVDDNLGISLGVTREIIEKAYQKHDSIKGVVVTYPNYHGICTALSEITEFVHDHKGIVLVDGAHGAHLNLSSVLPKTAFACGADIVVHSTHKSLPAFTQSSLLHYCSERISKERLEIALAMFQSSSPSYLLMASIENAVYVAKTEGEKLMKKLIEDIWFFKNEVEAQTFFEVLDQNKIKDSMTLDVSKITLLVRKSKLSGAFIEKLLREEYAIQCEYATDSVLLFITSIATLSEDLKQLMMALIKISQEIKKGVYKRVEIEELNTYNFKHFSLESSILPSKAIYMERIRLALKESIGAVAGDFIVPYPPGVPIVVPGEIISEQVVNYIEEGRRKGYNINGVYGDKILQVNIIRR